MPSMFILPSLAVFNGHRQLVGIWCTSVLAFPCRDIQVDPYACKAFSLVTVAHMLAHMRLCCSDWKLGALDGPRVNQAY